MGTQTQNVTMLLPLPHLGQLALLDRVVVREAIVFLINASVAYVWLLLSPVRPASPVFVIMFSSIPLFISPSISLTISIYLSHYLSLSLIISPSITLRLPFRYFSRLNLLTERCLQIFRSFRECSACLLDLGCHLHIHMQLLSWIRWC